MPAMVAFAPGDYPPGRPRPGRRRRPQSGERLWPLVARLEARAADGHLEAGTLTVFGQAWTSLGTSFGTVLPEERLSVAAQSTAKVVAAAEQLDDNAVLAHALAMHGDELRGGADSPLPLGTLDAPSLPPVPVLAVERRSPFSPGPPRGPGMPTGSLRPSPAATT